jgi:hypothetical protein
MHFILETRGSSILLYSSIFCAYSVRDFRLPAPLFTEPHNIISTITISTYACAIRAVTQKDKTAIGGRLKYVAFYVRVISEYGQFRTRNFNNSKVDKDFKNPTVKKYELGRYTIISLLYNFTTKL